jgi:hypothetical protein
MPRMKVAPCHLLFLEWTRGKFSMKLMKLKLQATSLCIGPTHMLTRRQQ